MCAYAREWRNVHGFEKANLHIVTLQERTSLVGDFLRKVGGFLLFLPHFSTSRAEYSSRQMNCNVPLRKNYATTSIFCISARGRQTSDAHLGMIATKRRAQLQALLRTLRLTLNETSLAGVKRTWKSTASGDIIAFSTGQCFSERASPSIDRNTLYSAFKGICKVLTAKEKGAVFASFSDKTRRKILQSDQLEIGTISPSAIRINGRCGFLFGKTSPFLTIFIGCPSKQENGRHEM